MAKKKELWEVFVGNEYIYNAFKFCRAVVERFSLTAIALFTKKRILPCKQLPTVKYISEM